MESFPERITRHEEIRLFPYRDSLGKLTIGVGHCLDTNPLSPSEIAYIGHDCRTQGITQEQANWLLAQDLDKCEQSFSEHFPFMLNMDISPEMGERQNVVVEMIFQLGIGTVLKFINFIRALKDENYEEAATQMLDSVWHKQTPSRCEELSDIMLTGKATI